MKLYHPPTRGDWRVTPVSVTPSGDENPRPRPFEEHTLQHNGLYVVAQDNVWDGVERRSGVDRRQEDRRTETQTTLLDTRSNRERRCEGRRWTDGPAPGGFYFKA